MTISSRTPEGPSNRCPVCGKIVNITPSEPSGDATCPHCGSLIWFLVSDAGLLLYSGLHFEPGDNRTILPDISQADDSKSVEIVGEPLPFDEVSKGDHVQIIGGYFKDLEGDVESIDRANVQVVVRINIFGRVVPVEVEYRYVKRLV